MPRTVAWNGLTVHAHLTIFGASGCRRTAVSTHRCDDAGVERFARDDAKNIEPCRRNLFRERLCQRSSVAHDSIEPAECSVAPTVVMVWTPPGAFAAPFLRIVGDTHATRRRPRWMLRPIAVGSRKGRLRGGGCESGGSHHRAPLRGGGVALFPSL
jgi:hypothetical protein